MASTIRRRRIAPWSAFWLALAVLYFLVPMYATAEFSLETGNGQYGFDAYRVILNDPTFKASFLLSLRLALETVVVSLIIMVPTVYWVHLKLPGLRRFMDFIAILPFMVPPITLAIGLLRELHPLVSVSQLTWLLSSPQQLILPYVILVMPFTYRSLDAGMRAIDLRIMTEAAQSVGANWLTILFRVILPNLRSALLSAAFLTVTIVMGEFTIASLNQFQTFSVYIQYIGSVKANPAAALSIISFTLTWGLMLSILIIGRQRGPQQQTQIGTTR
ncbi:MAG: ABC transporter permease [Chloroflexota bacterium]